MKTRTRFILPILLFCISYSNAKSQTDYLYFIRDTTAKIETCGYINDKKHVVIPVGKYVFCYTDTIKTIGFVGKAQVGIVAIDKSGKELFNVYIFDNGPDYVVEGLFRIIDSAKQVGFADTYGNIVILPQFGDAKPFKNGFAAICMNGYFVNEGYEAYIGGKWGFIDKTGKTVISPQFDFVRDFNNGTAAFCVGGEFVFDGNYYVWIGGKWGLINEKGEIIIPAKFDTYKGLENTTVYKDKVQKLSEVNEDHQ
jgi:hypothetical protein